MPTSLRLEEYVGEEGAEYVSWVLFDATAGGGEAEGGAQEAPEAAGSVWAVAAAGGGFRRFRRFFTVS